MKGWISTAELAALAGITRQAANRMARRVHEGAATTWLGVAVQVRVLAGQRSAGGKAYTISVASLPADLKERLLVGHSTPQQLDLPLSGPTSGRSAQMLWWTHHLKPALMHPAGSAERSAAVVELVGKTILDWHNRPITLGRSTVYRRLAQLEASGMAALGRKRRADTGKDKVLISREWDKAVPFDEPTRLKIAEHLTQEIRGLRAKRTNRKLVLLLAQDYLKRDTAAHGYRPNEPGELDRICEIPLQLYTREAKYQAVYDLTKDRDRFDNDSPRVKRHSQGMRPMEIVVMDVHPVDVLIRREDGETGSARLLGFMDLATKRVWCELVFVEGVGGVRNVDVIRAFLSMAQHPAWGIPEKLYCDNGSEYLFAGYLDDALQLNGRSQISGERRSRVIRAIPYNASAKSIEGWFHRLESDYLRHLPGWHGGKLGAPKRPARGKLPQPFAGGFDAFCEAFFGLLRAYEVVPQHGELKGISPAQAFDQHVANGWAATLMDPADLLTVFARTETRIVRQHGVQVDGRSWNAVELDAYFDRTVTVKIPVLGFGFNELWVGNERGEFLCIAKPDIERRYDDTRHAKHSAERKSVTTAAARQLRRDAPDINVVDRLARLTHAYGVSEPNEPIGAVSVSALGTGALAIIPSKRSRATDRADVAAATDRQLAALEEINRLRREAKQKQRTS